MEGLRKDRCLLSGKQRRSRCSQERQVCLNRLARRQVQTFVSLGGGRCKLKATRRLQMEITEKKETCLLVRGAGDPERAGFSE